MICHVENLRHSAFKAAAMSVSSIPLVLSHCPHLGDPHPEMDEWHAVNVRTTIGIDVRGKIVYLGPQEELREESFVLRSLK